MHKYSSKGEKVEYGKRNNIQLAEYIELTLHIISLDKCQKHYFEWKM